MLANWMSEPTPNRLWNKPSRLRKIRPPSGLTERYNSAIRSTTGHCPTTYFRFDSLVQLHVKVSTIWEWTRRRNHKPIPHYPVSSKAVYFRWSEGGALGGRVPTTIRVSLALYDDPSQRPL